MFSHLGVGAGVGFPLEQTLNPEPLCSWVALGSKLLRGRKRSFEVATKEVGALGFTV